MRTASLLSPYVLYPKERSLSWHERIVDRDNTYEFTPSDGPAVLPIYNLYRNMPNISAHHHRFLEISLILSGTGTACIDKRETPLTPGTLLFINHLQEHAESFRTRRVEKLILAMLPSVIESGLSLSMSNGMFRAFSLTEPFFRNKAVNAVALDDNAADRIARSWCGLLHAYNTGASDDAVIAHTRSLLEHIVSEHGRRTAASSAKESAIAPALYHLRMNVRTPDVAAAIASTGLSKSHFYKRFGEEIGMPVGKYIMTLRISRAKSMLRSTSLPVSHIASDLGFYDESHMHRTLKREAGESVAAFRNKNGVQVDRKSVPGRSRRI
ncbi:MAG: AraC family transcriptional regulator [Spirochaetota bacterium]